MDLKIHIQDHDIELLIENRRVDPTPVTLRMVVQIIEEFNEYRIIATQLEQLLTDMEFRNPPPEKAFQFLQQMFDDGEGRGPNDASGSEVINKYPETALLFDQGFISQTLLWNQLCTVLTSKGLAHMATVRKITEKDALQWYERKIAK